MGSPINRSDPTNNYPPFATKVKKHWFKPNEVSLPDAKGKEVWVASSAIYKTQTPHLIEFGVLDERGAVHHKEYRYVDLTGVLPDELLKKWVGATTIGKALAAKRIFHRLEQLGKKNDFFKFESPEQCIQFILSLPDPKEILHQLNLIVEKMEKGEALSKEDKEVSDILSDQRIFLAFKPELDYFGITFENPRAFFKLIRESDIISEDDLEEVVSIGNPAKKNEIMVKIAVADVFQKNHDILPVQLRSEEEFTSLVLHQSHQPDNFAKLRYLSKVPAFFIKHEALFQKYGITQEVSLTNYFLHHVAEMSILGGKSEDPYHVELLCERVHNMIGLESFYRRNAKGLEKAYGWKDIKTFIQDMELADMSLSKLLAMIERPTYKEDLHALKNKDIPLYQKNKALFEQANVSFPRYLRFVEANPVLREQLEKLQALPLEFVDALKGARTLWIDRTYDQYRTAAIDDLWKAQKGRWEKPLDPANPAAVPSRKAPRTFKPAATGWSKEHYVEIIAHAQSLLERGNLPRIMRIYKESTGFARTVTINPKEGRIIIHIKQKDVDQPASHGSSKKVSTAIVIEKGKAEIVADIVIYAEPGKDPMAAQAEFEILKLLQGHPNIPEMIRDVNSSADRMYCTQENFTIRDLREAFAYPLKERLHLMIGVLKGLRHLHSKGLVHKDVKLENMSSARGEGMPFDFGLAVDRGVPFFVGSPRYMYPTDYASNQMGKPPPSSIVGDLWGFGIALYEMLSTRPNASKEQATFPPFLVRIEGEAEKDLARIRMQKRIPTFQDILAAFQKSFAPLDQEEINDDIANFEAVGNGVPKDSKVKVAFDEGMRKIFNVLLGLGCLDADLNSMLEAEDEIIANLEQQYDILP